MAEAARRSAAVLLRPHTVREYQRMFNDIYGDVNNAKYDDGDLIRLLGEYITKVNELSRKDYRSEFAVQLPRIYSWCNAIANRKGIDLQDALWHKFPGVCSRCFRNCNCLCAIEHPNISDEERETRLRHLRRDRVGREPINLADHQAFHSRLYGAQNARITLDQTVQHISEEWGELSAAERHGDLHEICDELADVVSWVFSTAIRLNLDFNEIVWARFPFECEKCHNSQCDCKEIP